MSSATPRDDNFANQWYLHNTGQVYATQGGTPISGTAGADVNGPEVWDRVTGWKGVAVALLDDGVNYNHTDLNDNIWTNPGEIAGNSTDDDGNYFVDDIRGYDFFDIDRDPLNETNDLHGTQIAGIIGAEENDATGIVGIAWQTQIIPVRIAQYDAGVGQSVSSITASISGIDYIVGLKLNAGINVPVINYSYGVDDEKIDPVSRQLLEDAVARARDAGILFVTAAGNTGRNIVTNPVWPASSELANVLTVGATTDDDGLAVFSNRGSGDVPIAAPGELIYTTSGSTYKFVDGTSFAAPLVAGVAALAFSVAPGADYVGVKQAILNGADQIGLSGIENGRRLNARGAIDQLTSTAVSNLYVNGTSGNDTILVRPKPGDITRIQVVVGGVVTAEGLASQISGVAVNGFAGADTITVDASITRPVIINGGTDSDSLLGAAGADRISGGGGNDTIVGSTGHDLLTGGRGDDSLDGSGGNDTLTGGQGNDTLSGSTGVDLADFSFLRDTSKSIYVVLDDVANDSVTGESTADYVAINIENVRGGIGADTITGSGGTSGANEIWGGDGADSIDGVGGNDTIHGGNGDDYLLGGSDNDYLYGDPGRDSMSGVGGNDVFFALDGEIDTLLGGSGTDTASEYDASLDLLNSIP